ncbi:MAG: crossover junction endodeoxyribonuclease RuvC [Bifidobacteriaceae bacterium]|jgi:crossover junction endodeoxyribonuclease RuvC|nr:crossover junction endodeoxyribonuclease RuvC [Bifidobacteriaceae bacterium]
MRVLGVDPGLTRCGLAVIDALPGRRVTLVDFGAATSPADETVDRRLLAIAEAIGQWLERHRPDAVAVERVFAQRNAYTVAGTMQASGVAMVEAARRGIEVGLHTPTEVKAAVTGNGDAPKEQVARMVTRVLGLAEPPRPADAADALALAICHAWRPATLSATGGAAATPAQKAWVEAARAARRRRKTWVAA